MNAGVGIALFICLVIIVIVGVAFKCNTDCDIEYLKTKVDYLNIMYHPLDIQYMNLDKRCDDMFDIIKMQQEEIKELKRMIEPEEKKKPCCSNCRFYYELNDQDSACLNVNINNKHKGDSTIYANGKSISCGTIKRVEPDGCCGWYEPKEVSDE